MKPFALTPHSIDVQLFQAIPGNSILLLTDAHHFTIVAATDDYIRTTGKSRRELVGKQLFEVFLKTSDVRGEESERTIRHSLAQVLEKKAPHRLPVFRYDVANTKGLIEERYWSVVNTPVLNNNGEVVYIIHTAEDHTDQVKAEKIEKDHQELERAYHQIEESQRELQKAHQRIIDILESTSDAFYALNADFNLTYVNNRAAYLWGRKR
ncbi:MAG TPA: PAS domain-containing protein, partial [Flavisolibacter sp.]|nr:PAS domain-containing protein [Flavisolibacter sp.]